ncbi:hypothetical protein [Leisingera sp. M658]|nr:hypothetical protein [Leisingera sp. M658]UWQ73603.1 hypothetical protein K3724_13715 [Leisingera sp. M658]
MKDFDQHRFTGFNEFGIKGEPGNTGRNSRKTPLSAEYQAMLKKVPF